MVILGRITDHLMQDLALLGEYPCRLDSKNRLHLPAPLHQQLGDAAQKGFVLHRGFEPCLVLYPQQTWDKLAQSLQQLNLYVQKNRVLVRYFFRGATPLSLDAQGRLLLPTVLLPHAQIEQELVLFAYFDRIELWSPQQYEACLNAPPSEMAALAEEVMGLANGQGETDKLS